MNSTESPGIPVTHCKPVSKNVEYAPPHYEPYGDNLWRATFGYECNFGYTTSTAPESRIITCVEIKSAPQWKDANGDLLEALPECNFSIGLGVGIGVGLPLTIVIFVLIYLLCREKRRRKHREKRSKRMSGLISGKKSDYVVRRTKKRQPSTLRTPSVNISENYLTPNVGPSVANEINPPRMSNIIESHEDGRRTIYGEADYAVADSLGSADDNIFANGGFEADAWYEDNPYDNNFIRDAAPPIYDLPSDTPEIERKSRLNSIETAESVEDDLDTNASVTTWDSD